jgi:hypothetical protein
MATPFDYHNDPERHGEYQYLTLKEFIDEFMIETIDDDSYIKNVRRSLVVKRAKQGIRAFNQMRMGPSKAMEITVPSSLYVALPHDYVAWKRVSVVVWDTITNSYRLEPLDVNKNINKADGYLQNNSGEILFDIDGYILKADTSNYLAKPYKKYEFGLSDVGLSGNAMLHTDKLSKYGEFSIDEENGKISFSSNLDDKEIVLEYRSDGLSFDTYKEEAIVIHKDWVQALNDYVYFKCIERRAGVPQMEKSRALLRFKTSRHEAKLDRAEFNMQQLIRVMNTNLRPN